jgi:hypothetical protein
MLGDLMRISRAFSWVAFSAAVACAPVANPLQRARESAAIVPSSPVVALPPTLPQAGAANVTVEEPGVTADFTLVKELACADASLHVLAGKTFLSCEQELLVVEGNELRSDPGYQRGLVRVEPSFIWNIGSMAGDWPDAAWLGSNRTLDISAQARFHRWTGDHWVRVGDARRYEPVYWLLPWTKGCILALVQPDYSRNVRFIPLGAKAFVAPRFTQPKKPNNHCMVRMYAQAYAVLGPGDIMLAGGAVCDAVTVSGQPDAVFDRIGVERFQASKAQGELILLPGVPVMEPDMQWKVTAMVAVTPQKVLVAAQSVMRDDRKIPLFARWDGNSFSPEASPIEGGIENLWVESPEVLWATDLQGQLWIGRSGHWQRVRWQPPKDHEIAQIWARGADDVWLVTQHHWSGPHSSVFHGRLAR